MKTEPKIKNIYAKGYEMPLDKARLSAHSILIKPITYKDFAQGAVGLKAVSPQDTNEAWLFEVINIGPKVTICAVGEYVIPTNSAIDVVLPSAKYLILQEEDVRAIFTQEQLN